jgi:site-specific recombinase XerD
MARMRPPAVPEQPVPVLAEDELRTLVRTTERDSTFYGRRDAAMLRVFIDSGARLAEVAALSIEDVSLESGTVRLMGKGRRIRINPIGTKAIRALDRYLRIRAKHPEHANPAPVARPQRSHDLIRRARGREAASDSGRHRPNPRPPAAALCGPSSPTGPS